MRAQSRDQSVREQSQRAASRQLTQQYEGESIRSNVSPAMIDHGASQGTVTGAGQVQQAAESPRAIDTQSLLKMPLSQLTEEQKQMMIVEERYSFFQIENKLRQLCQETIDQLRTRVSREAELIRKVQMQAESAKRDVASVEPRLEKALQANIAVQKCFQEINGLEQSIRLESEKAISVQDMIDTQMAILDSKMQTQTQQFNAEMGSIQDLRQTVNIGLSQIQTYKEQLTQKIEDEVTGYRLHVAQLESPQKQMQIDMKELQRQMFQLATESNQRASAQEVIDHRIKIAYERIEELKQQKLDFKEYVKFEAKTDFAIKNMHKRFEQIEATLRQNIDYMIRYQPREMRNVVNRALLKVTRPLQMKDLFYSNVVDLNPQLFYEQLQETENSQENKKLDTSSSQSGTDRSKTPNSSNETPSKDASKAELPEVQTQEAGPTQDFDSKGGQTQVNSGTSKAQNPIIEVDDQNSLDSKDSRAAIELKSLLSKQSKASTFKTPNLILHDFKFEPNVAEDEIKHPVLGVSRVNNVHDIDWNSLREYCMQEWSQVCQEQYDAVVKLGNAPSTPSKAGKSIAGSSLRHNVDLEKHTPQIDLPPLMERNKKSKKRIRKDQSRLASQLLDMPGSSGAAGASGDIDGQSVRSKRDKKEKKERREKKDKKRHNRESRSKDSSVKPKRDPTRGKISVDDQSEPKVNSHKITSQGVSSIGDKAEQSIHAKSSSKKKSERQERDHERSKSKKEKKQNKERRDKNGKRDRKRRKKKRQVLQDSMQQDSIQMPEQNIMLNEMNHAHQSTTQRSLLSKKDSSKRSNPFRNVVGAAGTATHSQEGGFDVENIGLKSGTVAPSPGLASPRSKQQTMDPVSRNSKFVGSKKQERRETVRESIASSSEEDQNESESDSDESDSDYSRSSDSGSEGESDSDSDESETESSSSEEYEEDIDIAEQDAADCEALGVDLMRFLKKAEFEFYKEKMQAKIEKLQEMIDIQEVRLDTEIKAKGEEYSKGIHIIEERLNQHMLPVHDDIQTLIKSRARQYADDIIAQNRVLERFNTIKKEFENIHQTVTYSLCPIVCCLLETQCVQLACEEQEELDRLKIALYGHKENIQKKAEEAAKMAKEAERLQAETERQWRNSHIVKCGKKVPQKLDSLAHWKNGGEKGHQITESMMINENHHESVQTVMRTAENSTIQIPTTTRNINVVSQQDRYGGVDQSLFEHTAKGSPVRDEFMGSIIESHYGETRDRASLLQPHLEKQDTFLHQSVWQKRKPASEVVSLDQKCLNCTSDVAHTAKLFKIACLAYTPGQVNYRNQQFTRQQLLAIRKFLIGQTTQLVFQTPTMKHLNLSTKKIFDDIHIHLENQARNKKNISQEAHAQFRLIESEQNEVSTLRSIFFKTKDQALSMFETSLQNSMDYTQYNTCEDYVQTARNNMDKFAPVRQTLETVPNDQTSVQFSAEYSQAPLTARDRNDIRKGSVDIGGPPNILHTSRNSRNFANVTTAPLTQHRRRPSALASTHIDDSFFDASVSNSFGLPTPKAKMMMLKGQNMNIDIQNAAEMNRQNINKTSIFQKKRNTAQPTPLASQHTLDGPNRNLYSASGQGGGTAMSNLAKRAFNQAGCKKEQQKQYVSYMNETQRNTEAIRQRLYSQPVPANKKKVNDLQKALVAIMPLQPQVSNNGIHNNSISKQTDSVFLDPSPTVSKMQMKKSLPPISDSNSIINVKKNSSIILQ